MSAGDAGATPARELSAAEARSFAGRWSCGPGATDEIEITEKDGQLTLARKDRPGRRLFYLGDRKFHPAGAANLQILFGNEEAALMTLTVHDGGLVIKAKRR